MKSFLTVLALCFCTLAFGQGSPTGLSSPILTNFYPKQFEIHPELPNTQLIKLHLNTSQFDEGGDTITLTNLFGPGTTNIFQTFITTNLYAQIEYVTNLYVTYLVSSNSISGNIQGTPPHLSMFFPDNFSLADSIVTQNADTNGVTVNGSGNAEIDMGGTNFEKIVFGTGGTNQLYRTNSFLVYTNNADILGEAGFKIINSIASVGVFEVVGNIVRIRPENAGGTVDLGDTTFHYARWWNNTWTPLNAAAELGHNGGGQYPWGDFKMSGTEYVYGFNPDVSDAFNYSRLAISHTGTNGAVVFDSQSAGTAGPPKPFDFDFGNTNYFQISLVSDNLDRPKIALLRPDGSEFDIQLSISGVPTFNAVGNQIYVNPALVTFNSVFPPGGSSVDIGQLNTDGQQYRNVVSTNFYAIGFKNGVNYSRFNITHTGTNGAIVFDSQSFGTSGAPRDFAFASNTVVIATVKADTRFLRMNDSFGTPYLQAQYDNTTFGADAGTALTTGTENTAVGWESLKNLTDGGHNVAIGEAMGTSIHANNNTAVGWRALRSVEGMENVGIGYNCMTDNTTNSIFIGARAHITQNNLTNVIGIGYNVAVTNNNEIVIGNITNTAVFTPPIVLRNVTKAEKTAMTPVDGMIVYQTDNTPGLRAYIGGSWVILSTAADP